MSGIIEQRLHPERVPDERLREVWSAVYEGYTEQWDQEALLDMAAVGEEACSALEELVELRARVREAAQLLAIVNKCGGDDSDLRRRIAKWLTPEERELA